MTTTATKTIKRPTKTELRKASDNSREVFSSWVKNSRVKAKLSQEALAEYAGVDRKTINRIENGHFSPSLDTMARLSVVLRTNIPRI
jgi:DNA-binding XRE family transcriptional regulator